MRGQPAGVLFRPWLPWLLGIKMSNLLPVPAAARLSPIHTAGLALAQPAFGFGNPMFPTLFSLVLDIKIPRSEPTTGTEMVLPANLFNSMS